MLVRHAAHVAAVVALGFGACTERAPVPEPVSEAPAEAAALTASAVAASEAPSTQTPKGTEPARPGAASTRPSKALAAPRALRPDTPEIPFEGRRIALVHTANVIGELEPCG